MGRLSNRVAMITGATGAIGAATARIFARQGAALALTDLNADGADALVAELTSLGQQVTFATMDVGSREQVASVVRSVEESLGPIDILVNNAGISIYGAIDTITDADWHKVMQINLTGVFLCTQAALPPMIAARAGRIVNIASTAGQKGYAYCTAYVAAKHGVLGLTRSLALEVAAQGIAVNAVCPGYTDTAIVRDGVARIVAATGRDEADAMATFSKASPLQRLVEPGEVAATVLWLCADAPAAFTGQAMSLSGGEVMN